MSGHGDGHACDRLMFHSYYILFFVCEVATSGVDAIDGTDLLIVACPNLLGPSNNISRKSVKSHKISRDISGK